MLDACFTSVINFGPFPRQRIITRRTKLKKLHSFQTLREVEKEKRRREEHRTADEDGRQAGRQAGDAKEGEREKEREGESSRVSMVCPSALAKHFTYCPLLHTFTPLSPCAVIRAAAHNNRRFYPSVR
jgi:hypothetical protein